MSGPWPPPWPESAAPGCGSGGNGGDRRGGGQRVVSGAARDVRASPVWPRRSAMVGRDAVDRLGIVRSACDTTADRSALCRPVERAGRRERWTAARRFGLTGARAGSGDATLGTEAAAACCVSCCACVAALDATAAACVLAASRLFVASSRVFVDSGETTAAAAEACDAAALAWATAASTSLASWPVPKGSAARAVAGAMKPQAIAPATAHARATRLLRPGPDGSMRLASTGRSNWTFPSSRKADSSNHALTGALRFVTVSVGTIPDVATTRRRARPRRARRGA